MILDVRLDGTQEECELAVSQISAYFAVLKESRFYPNRRGLTGRVYLTVKFNEERSGDERNTLT